MLILIDVDTCAPDIATIASSTCTIVVLLLLPTLSSTMILLASVTTSPTTLLLLLALFICSPIDFNVATRTLFAPIS
jgi:hypothetical protein